MAMRSAAAAAAALSPFAAAAPTGFLGEERRGAVTRRNRHRACKRRAPASTRLRYPLQHFHSNAPATPRPANWLLLT